MIHDSKFNIFWQKYPRRNGKKIGKKLCREWFELHKSADVDAMVAWLEVDNGNREHAQKVFYASLPDPIRFLTREMWEDDIEPIRKKGQRTDICHTPDCEDKWIATYENRGYCRKCLKELRGY